jgi:serine/threonine-protein kinase
VERILGERYRLLSKLGEGGMGQVFRARDLHTGRELALKLVLPGVTADSAERRRLRREAEILSELSHPSLVALRDFSFEGEEPYLVFDLVEGETLEDALRSGPLSATRALDIAGQIAQAMGVLHAAKLLHRDLKPANIMLRPGDMVCVLDFGIAKHFGDAAAGKQESVTMLGAVVGTLPYMPPECVFPKDFWTSAYDVWSIGVILYEMLVGERPFARWEAGGGAQFFDAARAGHYRAASERRREVPRAVDALIAEMLAAEPHARPADGAEAAREIERVMEALAMRGGGAGAAGGTATLGGVGVAREGAGDTATTPATARQRQALGASDAVGSPPEVAGPRLAWARAAVVGGAVSLIVVVAGLEQLTRRQAPPPQLSVPPVPHQTTSPATLPQAAVAHRIRILVSEILGDDLGTLEQRIADLNKCARKSNYTTSTYDCFVAIGGSDRAGRVRDLVAKLDPLREGTTDVALLSALLRLQVVDDFAASVGARATFGHALTRALGRYGHQDEFRQLDGGPIYGNRIWSSIKEHEEGRWIWPLPSVPARDAHLALVFNQLHPKAVLEVRVNESLRLYFRNRAARAGQTDYRLTYRDVVDAKLSGAVEYTSREPWPHYVVLSRRVPRESIRTGPNSVGLRFFALPGPLRLAAGMSWDGSTDGSLWAGYLGFPVR